MQRFTRSAIRLPLGARLNSKLGASEQIRAQLEVKIPEHNKKVKALNAKHGDVQLSSATIGAAYGGMRGITAMVYEPSLLDAQEGIRFRGLSIPECQQALPKVHGGTEMAAEGMLWLLLTGEVPTDAQVAALSEEMSYRATSNPSLMAEVEAAVDALPKDLHPMAQFASAILALQKDSQFAKEYAAGMKKADYWKPCLEDTLNVMSRIIVPAAQIYRRTFHDGKLGAADPSLDWSARLCQMMGFNDPKFWDLMRLYMSIHTDHEGGNVSAHTAILVGSALSDPYYSYAASMCGLAGPLHGLANQEVLNYVYELRDKFKNYPAPTNEQEEKELLTKITWDEYLNKGRVVPGYGHAVLRKTDPRYMAQREFALKNLPNDPLFKMVSNLYEIMPGILTEHGKTKNPYPNVDAHSGVLLTYYGLTEQDFYTVLFGVSRGLGVLSALTWERAQGKAIERPKTTTTEALLKQYPI